MQNKLEKIAWTLASPISGSCYENFYQLPWKRYKNSNGVLAHIELSKGDALASSWYRRGWKWVQGMGVEDAVYKAATLEFSSKGAVDAVSYLDGDKPWVAKLPEGVEFGYEENGKLRTAAMREGPGPLIADMGKILESGEFISFSAIKALGRLNIYNSLPARYPNTPVF